MTTRGRRPDRSPPVRWRRARSRRRWPWSSSSSRPTADIAADGRSGPHFRRNTRHRLHDGRRDRRGLAMPRTHRRCSGFPPSHFAAESVLLHPVDEIDKVDIVSGMIRAARRLIGRAARAGSNEFAFLLVDGLSLAEDRVAAACSDALGPVPLFGGSAGDGTRFRRTSVAIGGEVYSNAAVLTYFRTDCRVRVFSLDHLIPTEHRMVVTGADPERRIVREINAEPAAREYARILGKDPEQLDTFTFAAHPVAVRFGGKHHVRAIQQVKDRDGVWCSSRPSRRVWSCRWPTPNTWPTHLERELAALSQDVGARRHHRLRLHPPPPRGAGKATDARGLGHPRPPRRRRFFDLWRTDGRDARKPDHDRGRHLSARGQVDARPHDRTPPTPSSGRTRSFSRSPKC